MTTPVTFKSKDMGYNQIVATFKQMAKAHTLVGLPGVGSPQVMIPATPTSPAKPAGFTVAALGVVHEFGVPSRGIPSRPFMRQTWDRHGESTKRLIRQMFKLLMTNKIKLYPAMGKIGAYYEGQVKTTIRNGVFQSNTAATLAKKKSSKPLIDTGLMRASVTHKVVL